MPNILFLGMDGGLAEALSAALPADRFSVKHLSGESPDELRETKADLVCLPGEREKRRLLLKVLNAAGAAARFVVIGPRPTPHEWLEAVREGAVDYVEPDHDPAGLAVKLEAATCGAPIRTFLSVHGYVRG